MKTLDLNQMENLKGGLSAWGCAAGFLIVGSSLLGGFNPLGIIAGAMVLDKYC
jgi:hypothetical protein